MEKRLDQAPTVQDVQQPVETIGSLMAECETLEQHISSEKDRLERFMLETGGASDASDRMEERIAMLEDMLASAEGRLQKLFDAQEKEAFAPEREAVGRPSVMKDLTGRNSAAARNPPDMKRKAADRVSVIKDLAEGKAAARKVPEIKKEGRSPGMDFGR